MFARNSFWNFSCMLILISLQQTKFWSIRTRQSAVSVSVNIYSKIKHWRNLRRWTKDDTSDEFFVQQTSDFSFLTRRRWWRWFGNLLYTSACHFNCQLSARDRSATFATFCYFFSSSCARVEPLSRLEWLMAQTTRSYLRKFLSGID